ncbi:hypothetical protein E2562_009355 [Oryza meyeriana var. granulata]|uniref:Uncharacterized protein n=1 Tax=Oryza meyeriana var. granulata TaxID=110450 RepID=A0A6G1CF33_9ORYZ|nr:hypothetical protein E2562_009355 [Oryza meyeriana var. granulata]
MRRSAPSRGTGAWRWKPCHQRGGHASAKTMEASRIAHPPRPWRQAASTSTDQATTSIGS